MLKKHGKLQYDCDCDDKALIVLKLPGVGLYFCLYFSYFSSVYVFGLDLVRILKLDNCTKLCSLSTEYPVTFDCSDSPPCSWILDANYL